MGEKNVVQKLKVQRNLGPNKFLVQTNFGSKNFLTCKGDSSVFQWCLKKLKSLSRELQKCFKEVSQMFIEGVKSVSRKLIKKI